MSAIQNAAARVRPCIVRNTADATGQRGLLFRYSLAGAPASTAVAVPRDARGVYVDLLPRGADVQYGFVREGDTAPTLVYDQQAAMGTGHAAAGKTLIAGVEKPVFVPQNAKQIVFIWKAATADAFFEANISSERVAVGA